MRITITARHGPIPDELRVRARELVARLTKIAVRPHHAQIVFVEDGGMPTVEVQLHRAHGVMHVGKSSAADHRTALDRAVAKVRRQLDKTPARRRVAVRRRARERERR